MSETHWPERSNGADARGVGGAAGAPRPPRCAWTRTVTANTGRTASSTAVLVRPIFMIHPWLIQRSTLVAPRLCLRPTVESKSLSAIGLIARINQHDGAAAYPPYRYAAFT